MSPNKLIQRTVPKAIKVSLSVRDLIIVTKHDITKVLVALLDAIATVDCCQTHGLVIDGVPIHHKRVHKGTKRSPDEVTVYQINLIAIS